MQIAEGDVIASIRDNLTTCGAPGRRELDANQELYYSAIMRAIKETEYEWYVSQEFSLRNDADWAASLKQAYKVCDV